MSGGDIQGRRMRGEEVSFGLWFFFAFKERMEREKEGRKDGGDWFWL